MNDKEIRKLVKIVEESNISELEVSRWGKKVRIIKMSNNSNHTPASKPDLSQQENVSAVNEAVVETAVPPEPKPEAVATTQNKGTTVVEEKSKMVEINSPMVGTFYRAPGPDADPYINVGDQIIAGKILCIIEAMKLMNEIEAEITGKIVEILVENAQPVEYNQPLFRVAVE